MGERPRQPVGGDEPIVVGHEHAIAAGQDGLQPVADHQVATQQVVYVGGCAGVAVVYGGHAPRRGPGRACAPSSSRSDDRPASTSITAAHWSISPCARTSQSSSACPYIALIETSFAAAVPPIVAGERTRAAPSARRSTYRGRGRTGNAGYRSKPSSLGCLGRHRILAPQVGQVLVRAQRTDLGAVDVHLAGQVVGLMLEDAGGPAVQALLMAVARPRPASGR